MQSFQSDLKEFIFNTNNKLANVLEEIGWNKDRLLCSKDNNKSLAIVDSVGKSTELDGSALKSEKKIKYSYNESGSENFKPPALLTPQLMEKQPIQNNLLLLEDPPLMAYFQETESHRRRQNIRKAKLSRKQTYKEALQDTIFEKMLELQSKGFEVKGLFQITHQKQNHSQGFEGRLSRLQKIEKYPTPLKARDAALVQMNETGLSQSSEEPTQPAQRKESYSYKLKRKRYEFTLEKGPSPASSYQTVYTMKQQLVDTGNCSSQQECELRKQKKSSKEKKKTDKKSRKSRKDSRKKIIKKTRKERKAKAELRENSQIAINITKEEGEC